MLYVTYRKSTLTFDFDNGSATYKTQRYYIECADEYEANKVRLELLATEGKGIHRIKIRKTKPPKEYLVGKVTTITQMSINKSKKFFSATLWAFVQSFMPNYSSRDEVLEDDMLIKYLEGEDLDEDDLQLIKDEYDNDREKVKERVIELESKFAKEAIEAYYKEIF